jgi:hypothetical protein
VGLPPAATAHPAPTGRAVPFRRGRSRGPHRSIAVRPRLCLGCAVELALRMFYVFGRVFVWSRIAHRGPWCPVLGAARRPADALSACCWCVCFPPLPVVFLVLLLACCCFCHLLPLSLPVRHPCPVFRTPCGVSVGLYPTCTCADRVVSPSYVAYKSNLKQSTERGAARKKKRARGVAARCASPGCLGGSCGARGYGLLRIAHLLGD